MVTLAIDGSTKNTGLAVFNQGKLIYYECVNSNKTNVYDRIFVMVNRIIELYKEYHPTDIVMQDVLPQDVKHNQAVFKALIYLQAAIVLEIHKLGGYVHFYAASHWRAQVGIRTGRGIKRQTLKEASKKLIKAIYNIDVNDDISDAICLGIAYVKEHRSAF